MKDLLVVAVLAASFALPLTAHVATVARLLWRVRPWYRGVLALLLPPLVPIWAHEQRWRIMSGLWVAAVMIYAVARVAAAL
ncbi:MAG: hypothetical protein HY744_11000 [Deltaproteobacteria bacterium]|nr:hypothetical protein [Deltaproteobacteria bacterium]